MIPRVAYLMQDFMVGGIPTFIYNLTKELRGQFEFYFLASDNCQINPKFSEIGTTNYIGTDWEFVSKYLREENINIVQYGNRIEYKECALEAKVPVIIERTAGPRSCNLNREGVTHVISSTKGTVPLIRSNYNGPISVFYNGVDLNRLLNLKPDRLGFKDSDFVICYCARMGGVGQGFRELISAVLEIRKQHDVKLVLIGDRPKSSAENIVPELKALAQPMGTSCIFTGELLDPLPIMAGANLYVCPAHHHGISNSIIEACALGKAVIATNVGQTNEIVHHEKNGFLIPPKNIPSLINNIIKAINNPTEIIKFGEYGKKLVEREFNIQYQASKYANLYRKLLSDT